MPLNAIAVTPQGGHLLYVHAYTGTLHVLDIASKQRSMVSLPHKLYAVNALVAAPSIASASGIAVYAVSARNNSVTVLVLGDNLKTGREWSGSNSSD